jgi:cytochrome c oxidase subunit 4
VVALEFKGTLTDSLLQQAEKINPIYGISAEGYEGKGFVQSPPLEKS